MAIRSAATAISRDKSASDFVVLLLAKLSQTLRSSMWHQGKHLGLTPTQVRTLLFLSDAESGKRTLSALAKSHGIAMPTATGIVNALVRRKLVTREPNPEDRRSTVLKLTPEGEKISREVVGWEAKIRRIVDSLPYERQEFLLHALKDIIASLRPARQDRAEKVCYACDKFRLNAHPGEEMVHHCELLNRPLSPSLAVSDWPLCLVS